MVRCASEAIGLANTIRELGHEAHVRIWTDAAAARGLALRNGSGAIKHMETKFFGCSRRRRTLRIEKIRCTVNPADLMTKHLCRRRLVMLCDSLSIKHVSGRPSSAPKPTMDTEYISRASRAFGSDDKQQQTKSMCFLEPNTKRGSTNTESTVGRWLDE